MFKQASRKPAHKHPVRAALALLTLGLILPLWSGSNAYADPPPWAPAYGYRNKHNNDYQHQYRHESEGDDDDDNDNDQQDGRHWRNVYRQAPYQPVQPAYSVPYGIDRGTCNRQTLGQVLGGATGAAIGSTIGKGNGNTAAILGGTIIGVIVGGTIGQSMDRIDQGCVGQALEYGQDGRQVAWTDPSAGARYQVTPDKPYRTTQGQYCRKYLTDAVINGQNRQVISTACRQPNGAWQMVN